MDALEQAKPLSPASPVSIKKLIKIYLPFARSEVQRAMAYRFRLVLWILSGFVVLFANYFLWRAIFSSSGTGLMSGFTFTDMLVYILLMYAVLEMTGSPAGWIIGREVQDGSIAMNLIRPINYSARLFSCAVGGNMFTTVVIGGPLFLIVGFIFHGTTALPQVALFALSVFLSFCICHFFDMCFSMISFYTTYIWGLQMLKFALIRFLAGGLIPFVLMPESMARVFGLLPFAGLGYTPVMIFLGKYSGGDILVYIGLQIFWALFFWWLSVILWRWAIKRLTILGG